MLSREAAYRRQTTDGEADSRGVARLERRAGRCSRRVGDDVGKALHFSSSSAPGRVSLKSEWGGPPGPLGDPLVAHALDQRYPPVSESLAKPRQADPAVGCGPG